MGIETSDRYCFKRSQQRFDEVKNAPKQKEAQTVSERFDGNLSHNV